MMKKLLTSLILLCIFLFFSNKSFSQNTIRIDTLRMELQDIIDNATSNYGMEGIELSVIIEDSADIETFYSGIRAPGTPVDPAVNWHFAQASAGYVNYVALKLIEEGTMTLEDTIGMHMDAAAMGLDGSITVRSLMKHTSILNEMWENFPATRCFDSIWASCELGFPSDILNCYDQSKTSAGAYDVNNMNLYVLGYLIDSVTGNSYEDEVQTRIFDPFEMTGTYLSSGDTVNIDSINGIWHTNFGYQSSTCFTKYFSTSGANRGLVSKSYHVGNFYRALFQNKLLPDSVMDSVKAIIPGSAFPQGSYDCATSIVGYGGYNTDIVVITNSSGDTDTLYGKGGLGMNGHLTFHWPNKDWTFSMAQNDRSRALEQRNLFVDLYCLLVDIDSVRPVVNSLKHSLKEEIKIYPNPVKDQLYLDFGKYNPSELILMDMRGMILDEVSLNSQFLDYQIPENLANGTYVIKIITPQESAVFKIQIHQ